MNRRKRLNTDWDKVDKPVIDDRSNTGVKTRIRRSGAFRVRSNEPRHCSSLCYMIFSGEGRRCAGVLRDANVGQSDSQSTAPSTQPPVSYTERSPPRLRDAPRSKERQEVSKPQLKVTRDPCKTV